MVFLPLLSAHGHEKSKPPGDFVLVTNAKNGVPSRSVSIAKVLSGRSDRWPDGTKAVLVLPPAGSPAMRWLSEDALGMPEKMLRRFLLQQVFRGAVPRPIEARSVAQAVDILRNHRGALAVLTPGTVQGDRGLKILELP
ncbi:MAG: hypothetical protein OEZ06_22660 [Myxococcales bacterium]|nr:hypothetical protein [Myxococcales bacterium]